ncbi:hypothetical protein SAMN06296020_104145 [Anoxynatronum buryatiense]|uniref:Uncharacterized protein n=1 Tax=Anoxynatronum buryatiense TaxID=489973 RepID=A0AA45WV80_9CLOT|nr:hypothetical protein SAMN06296020_104145 [Anoxynatronum buryatiense]
MTQEKTSGKCNIQFSGGEPTIRNDLLVIIKMGTDINGSEAVHCSP